MPIGPFTSFSQPRSYYCLVTKHFAESPEGMNHHRPQESDFFIPMESGRHQVRPEHFDSYRMSSMPRTSRYESAHLPHFQISDFSREWGGHGHRHQYGQEYVGRRHHAHPYDGGHHRHDRHSGNYDHPHHSRHHQSYEPHPHGRRHHGHEGDHRGHGRHHDNGERTGVWHPRHPSRHPDHAQRQRIEDHYVGRRGQGGIHRALDRPTDNSREKPFIQRLSDDVGNFIGGLAHGVASALGTVGDCAKGPRKVFEALMGKDLPKMVATDQGRWVENSGLFDRVPADQVRPGDYGYRHWNSRVTRAHGMDKGDSFIVHAVGRDGQLYGSNDHHFAVPPDGGRYRDLKFFRPNAKFFELYGDNIKKLRQQ